MKYQCSNCKKGFTSDKPKTAWIQKGRAFEATYTCEKCK